MTNFENINLEVKDGIARITLNRPDFANSMNLGLVTDLANAAMIIDNDDSVKLVALSANGKMFCAGGDLKSFASFSPSEAGIKLREVVDQLHKAIAIFARMKPLLLIGINGTAAGAGLSLSLIGDYVLATKSAKFTMAYTGAGLTADGAATYYLPRVIGLRRAQELSFTNRVLTAPEAKEWGIITNVSEDDVFQSEFENLIIKLANGPITAHGNLKYLYSQSFNRSLEEQLELEARAITKSISSSEGQEGIKAFIEKRAPKF